MIVSKRRTIPLLVGITRSRQRRFANGRTGSDVGGWVATPRAAWQTGAMRIEGWHEEIGGPRWWARLLTFAAFAGAMMGIFGPFGSYLNGSFLVLVLHWTFMSMFGALVCGLTVPHMVRWLGRRGFPLWFALLISLAILSLPLSAVAATEARWIWPWQVARLHPPDWYVQTLLPCLLTTTGWLLIEYARSTRARAPASGQPAQAALTGPVLCLQMEDHYVRVHRPGGSTLELMPLQEAIERYGSGGLQVHRSWWVAADAVVDAERDGRNWRLRLSNGLIVPVARNRIAGVRARQLIGPET